MVPVKVKLGDAILNLNLPAWLALRLKLSNTVAKTGKTFILISTELYPVNHFQFLMINCKQFFNIQKYWSKIQVHHKAS